jgi:hypothetical protein
MITINWEADRFQDHRRVHTCGLGLLDSLSKGLW